MPAEFSQFEEMKRFVGFSPEDAANLRAMAPVFEAHGPKITESFYSTLGGFPVTAGLIEGRVDSLKATHGRWMSELFGGTYEEAYFANRVRIGEAHVRIGVHQSFSGQLISMFRSTPDVSRIPKGTRSLDLQAQA